MFLIICVCASALFYVSCNLNEDQNNVQNLEYDLSTESNRISYLEEIRNMLISKFEWKVVQASIEKNHHCPPEEISANEECETFTGPVRVYFDEDFYNSLGLPINLDCFVTGTIEVTFCITPLGVDVSWRYRQGSIVWSNCPEIRDFLSDLSPSERNEIVRAMFDYGRDNYENEFFDQWVGNQQDRFICGNTFSYVLESENWSSKCEGSCIFWNTETNEIESRPVACGDGCCATVTTWCWDSDLEQVVSTPGVNIQIDGECSFSPNETCDGWLISCRESEGCQ